MPRQENREILASNCMGTVKFWDNEKGYGFIARDEENEDDCFVHITDVYGDVLQKGDRVEFDITHGRDRKRYKAINVQVVQ